MNVSVKIMRWMAILLSMACLLAMSGCQGRHGSQTSHPDNEEVQNVSSVSVLTSGDASTLSSTTTIPSSATASAASEASGQEEDRSPVTSPNKPPQSNASTAESVVPFWVGECPTDRFLINTNPNPNRSFYAQIVRSVEELESLYHEEGFREECPGFSTSHTEAFFETYAVVYFSKYLPSISDQIRVNSLIRNHDQLIIDYTIEKAVFADGATAMCYKLLQVNKSDVDGVVDIVPQQHEAQLGE